MPVHEASLIIHNFHDIDTSSSIGQLNTLTEGNMVTLTKSLLCRFMELPPKPLRLLYPFYRSENKAHALNSLCRHLHLNLCSLIPYTPGTDGN